MGHPILLRRSRHLENSEASMSDHRLFDLKELVARLPHEAPCASEFGENLCRCAKKEALDLIEAMTVDPEAYYEE
jgi:hypothetical protein